MNDLVNSVRKLAPVVQRPELLVKGSVGQGNWAAVPWLALMDRRVTKSTTRGYYVVFLFRADMGGVYLTLNQGVTQFREKSAGRGNPRAAMAQAASAYASKLETSGPAGFVTSPHPDLKSSTPLGKDYEFAAVTHKFYPAGRLPTDERLVSDLDAVLDDYERIVDQAAAPARQVDAEPARAQDTSPWDAFAYWAGMQLARPGFDEEERLYKLEIGARLADTRAKLMAGDHSWPATLKRAFGTPNNLTSWQAHSVFVDWCEKSPSAAAVPLSLLWATSGADVERVRGFLAQVPDETKAARRLMILAFLLMAMGPEDHPPYRTTVFEAGYGLTQYPGPSAEMDRAEEYEHAMGFLDRMLEECRARGVRLRDRLDAQSVLWAIVRNAPAEEWDADTRKRFLAYRGDNVLEDAMVDVQAVYDELCGQDVPIRFPEWIVSDYLLSLAAKPFVLLSGISGTGKTQIAGLVAKLLAGEDEVLEAQPIERDDPNSAYHTVGKSTLSYGLVIPRYQDHLFLELEPGPSTLVKVRTEDGDLEAYLGRVAFSGGRDPILRLMWRRPSLDWVRRVAEPGDVLKIQPTPEDPKIIRVEVLKAQRKARRTDARRVAFVPVRADWTDNRDLLGFYNVLTEQYEATDLLRVLLRAHDDGDRLHFVILDEMNLAKVEYYFADFLSAMETGPEGQGIPLHDQDEDVLIDLDGTQRLVPNRLTVPVNVFFTGTVNIDETTHMFSRKVLDRANVIEFHDVDVRRHMGLASASAAASTLRLLGGADVAKLLTQERDVRKVRKILTGKLAASLAAVHDILRDYNLHFGYRVVDECARYLWLTKANAGAEHLDAALDLQFLQKVLPKLAGNRSELQEPLERLLSYFTTGTDAKLDLSDLQSIRSYDFSNARMPLSAAKVHRMLERLTAVGFTSFVE